MDQQPPRPRTGHSGDWADSVTGLRGSRSDLLPEDDRPVRPAVEVALPEQQHEVPVHERAVALDEVSVDPSVLPPPTTTSVYLPPENVGPALPASDESTSAQAPERADSAEASDAPESSSMLTPDRLIERKRGRPAPEGAGRRLMYNLSLHAVNLGDSAKVRERKALDARIGRRLHGGTRFVPVLTRKGGVGKTTITTLIGQALADVREDRIVALDANPDRGTLSERVPRTTRATLRDVVQRAPAISSYGDFQLLVSTDETRLDVLASDTDPLLSEAFSEDDYNVVADLCAKYYSVALTDCGTGIVHSVMRPTLQRADAIVVVSGGSVDEAKLASETLTWLEANGYGELARSAIVALNTATQGTQMVKLDELEAHFRSRVRDVVRIPYDPQLAAGAVIDYQALKPITRQAARELAALVIDGLPEYKD